MIECRAMIIPPVELDYIEEQFRTLARDVEEALAGSDGADPESTSSAGLQHTFEAGEQLFEVLRRYEAERGRADGPRNRETETPISKVELDELGDYGIRLLLRLSEYAHEAELKQHGHNIERLSLPLALWVARNGGEIELLEPVVDCLANLANATLDSNELGQIWHLIREIFEAASPKRIEEARRSGHRHPWRILLLNWGIVATRTRRRELMEPTFETIVEQLPDDAANFFRDGMEQMDALNYPPQVRAIMLRYYEMWGTPRRYH